MKLIKPYSRHIKRAGALGAILLASACTQNFEIVGLGTVSEDGGSFSCDASQSPCERVIREAYQTTYTATPASGWEFDSWTGCGPIGSVITNSGNSCSYDLSEGAVRSNFGRTFTTTATFVESAPVAPDDSPSFVTCADATTCTLSGTIDQDYTMNRGVEWRLLGEVIVGTGNNVVNDAADVQATRDAGVTLTIESGVDVRAFSDGSLLVTRGSQLIAQGTAQSPITFSSLADEDFDGEGEWGGVILQGFAPQYGQGGTGACFGAGEVCNVEGEGGTVIGNFGGNDPADNSGIIRYVRIAEGGLVAGPNNEINGLTLQGVGYNTVVEYVQVHGNLDDGVEWFGGTVNARYLVLTNNDDDDIDYDEGYKGNIQFAIVRKNPNKADPTGSNDPRGIEANSSDDEYVPETEATLANIILVGSDVNNDPGGSEPGMRLRGALTTRIYNTGVAFFDTFGCVRIDDADTDGDGTDDQFSTVTLVNVGGDCDAGFYSHRAADTEINSGGLFTAQINAAWGLDNPEAILPEAPNIIPTENGSNFEFVETSYVGAVEPGVAAEDAWWAGWIIPGTL